MKDSGYNRESLSLWQQQLLDNVGLFRCVASRDMPSNSVNIDPKCKYVSSDSILAPIPCGGAGKILLYASCMLIKREDSSHIQKKFLWGIMEGYEDLIKPQYDDFAELLYKTVKEKIEEGAEMERLSKVKQVIDTILTVIDQSKNVYNRDAN